MKELRSNPSAADCTCRGHDGTGHVLPVANLSRREMLRLSGLGFGSLALQFLMAQERAFAASQPAVDLRPKPPHFDNHSPGALW